MVHRVACDRQAPSLDGVREDDAGAIGHLVTGAEGVDQIDRLESLRIIRGYTLVVDHARLGLELEAFAELTFVGTAPVDSIESLASEIPEIQAVFTIAGDPDALAWIRARSVADLTRVIDDIRRTGKVTGTKTLIVLGSQVEPRAAAILGGVPRPGDEPGAKRSRSSR